MSASEVEISGETTLWSWRTGQLREPDHRVITSHNIQPQSKEAKAVEMDYRRG
jgi:hypothetical protein